MSRHRWDHGPASSQVPRTGADGDFISVVVDHVTLAAAAVLRSTKVAAALARTVYMLCWLVVVLGCGLVTVITVVIAHVYIPCTAAGQPLRKTVLLLLTAWVSFQILFNYVCALTISPGQTAAADTERLACLTETRLTSLEKLRLVDKPTRFCVHCLKFKAPREHHCSLCRRCVPKMDHHCPWTNGCIGSENQRYFLLFVTHLLLGCALVVCIVGHSYWKQRSYEAAVHACEVRFRTLLNLSTAPERWYADASQLPGLEAGPPEVRELLASWPTSPYGEAGAHLRSSAVLLSLLTCAVIGVCMVVFVVINGYLLLTNQTQIERHIHNDKQHLFRNSAVPYRNMYDLGRWRNIVEVFATEGDRIAAMAKRGTTWAARGLGEAADTGRDINSGHDDPHLVKFSPRSPAVGAPYAPNDVAQSREAATRVQEGAATLFLRNLPDSASPHHTITFETRSPQPNPIIRPIADDDGGGRQRPSWCLQALWRAALNCIARHIPSFSRRGVWISYAPRIIQPLHGAVWSPCATLAPATSRVGRALESVLLLAWLGLPTIQPLACDGLHYPNFFAELELQP